MLNLGAVILGVYVQVGDDVDPVHLTEGIQCRDRDLNITDPCEEMRRLGTSSDVTQKAAKVLGTCEAVRYSQDGTASNAESALGMAQDVRELLTLVPKD